VADVEILGEQPTQFDHADQEKKKEWSDQCELDQARATLIFPTCH
jgi:hypothetical protein